MSTIIETKQATIDTMTVTIHALHVNGKQMTLAVFRQLPRDDSLFNWFEGDGELTGEPWGSVRYPIKDRGEEEATEWIVFSREGRLFRYARFKADRMTPREIEREAFVMVERLGHPLDKAKGIIKDRIREEQMQQGHELDVFESLPQLFIAV